jgi:hypothetical protein
MFDYVYIKLTILRYYYMTKNHILLYLGYTLINRTNGIVRLEKGKQVWTNKRRNRPYALDDSSWKIYRG